MSAEPAELACGEEPSFLAPLALVDGTTFLALSHYVLQVADELQTTTWWVTT